MVRGKIITYISVMRLPNGFMIIMEGRRTFDTSVILPKAVNIYYIKQVNC